MATSTSEVILANSVPQILTDENAHFWTFVGSVDKLSQIRVATLGPEGTSSEAAALYLLNSLGLLPWEQRKNQEYLLFPSYEEAFEQVVTGNAEMLLVANAYKGIDKFYMSSMVRLSLPFIFETPLYGIAKRPDNELPIDRPVTIATHHAPSSLIPWFLSGHDLKYEIVAANSTSDAAIKVVHGETDLCVTTLPSTCRYGVEFISPLRPIRMLWSVFMHDDDFLK